MEREEVLLDKAQLEFVGTITIAGRDKERVVNILRRLDPAVGFQYFLEENGELRSFDAFGEREYGFRMPYPVMLDRWMDMDVWPAVRSVDLKVYHIEEDAKIGGQELRVWWEKALRYYESGEIYFWREYWGLLKNERETLFYFFEKFFREEGNTSKKERWKLWEFHKKILSASLGEYRDKLVEHFISHLSYVLERGFKKPKNKAKGLLVWVETHKVRNWGWDIVLIMGTALNGLYEWDYLTAKEREEMALAIYDRLQELAEKEEKWAGLSLEKWLDLLKKKVVEGKGIEDTDTAFWKWIKHYIDRENLYDLLRWAFEGDGDWDWMPRKERRELASALEEYIIEKLEAEKECV
jgi:hypothetical protein